MTTDHDLGVRILSGAPKKLFIVFKICYIKLKENFNARALKK